MAIAHMVWMKFNDGVSQQRIEHHLSALSALPAEVPEIVSLNLGENFTDRAQGYTHGMLVVLESKEGLRAYADHPAHVPVANALREDASLMAMDYEY